VNGSGGASDQALERGEADVSQREDPIVEIRLVEQGFNSRHEELRRERARLEIIDASRHDELRAQIAASMDELLDGMAKSETVAADRMSELRAAQDRLQAQQDRLQAQQESVRADLARALARLERIGLDTMSHRLARYLRGALVFLRSLGASNSATDARRAARLLTDARARQTWSRLFDREAYLDAYPDVAQANIPAALHYLLWGHREGREPSSGFSGAAYLEANPDVSAAGFNPLLHYASLGLREGRACGTLVAHASAESSGGTPDSPAVEIRATVPQVPTDEPQPAQVMRTNTRWPDDRPLVSVVIPCFNYGRELRAALDSVLRQTWQDLEVIVVEGGSTEPDTVATVRAIEAERPPHTSFYYRDRRHLAGANRNFGIERAQGRYVVCLDADDTLDPVYLEVAVFLAEAYQFDLVYPSVQELGQRSLTWTVEDVSFEDMLERNAVSTVALFRRSAWVESGGFRDWGVGDTYVYEDWAYWTRLVGMGYRPKSIPAPLMRHFVHAGSLSSTATATLVWQRESARAVNDDLLGVASRGEITSPTLAANAFLNLLARPPQYPDGGAVLIAARSITPGQLPGELGLLGRSLITDAVRVIVATNGGGDADPSVGTPPPCDLGDYVYDLTLLFRERAEQEEFLLYLLQRYHVSTLVVAVSSLASEMLTRIRRTVPNLGIACLLSDASEVAGSSPELVSMADVTIVPTEELRTRLLEAREGSGEVTVIPRSSTRTGRPQPAGAPDEAGPMVGAEPVDQAWSDIYGQYREAFLLARTIAATRRNPPRA
jgi:hypothetical protein